MLWTIKLNESFLYVILYCSKKYPYPSPEGFFRFEPPLPRPSENSSFGPRSYFPWKFLAFETPLPVGISYMYNLPWGGWGFFLEPHIEQKLVMITFSTMDTFSKKIWPLSLTFLNRNKDHDWKVNRIQKKEREKEKLVCGWNPNACWKAIKQYFYVVLFIMLYIGGSNFYVCRWNSSVWPDSNVGCY